MNKHAKHAISIPSLWAWPTIFGQFRRNRTSPPSTFVKATSCTLHRTTMSTSSAPAISRASFASDLSTFKSLSPGSKTALNSSLAPPKPAASALHALNDYAPSTSSPETSQTLMAAYIKDMRETILNGDEGRDEGLGRRIDAVREQGEEVKGALGNVQL